MAYLRPQRFVRGEQPSLPPLKPSQKHILTIQQSSIQTDTVESDVSITEVAFLASYNWLTRGEQTILIPGCPPRWCPPVHSPTLKEDRGTYYRDKNSSQYPTYPMEPGVCAIFTMHPDFKGQEIDVFACGSTMGSLIAFLAEKEKTFRFTAEKIGGTLFLVRKENTADEIIPDVRGYGHTFPEVYTEWDEACVGSESHQRLITYSLGGLTCIVRSEADGYLPRKLDVEHPLKQTRTSTKQKGASELLLSTLPSISGATLNSGSFSARSGLLVRRGGEVVPQAAIFDLKTRSSRNQINMEEIFPRICINQTPNFILAYHTRGIFDNIQIQDVRAPIEDWENGNEDLLGRLRETLTLIDALVEKQPDGRVEVRRVAGGDLAIWTDVSARRALPAEVRAKWIGVVNAGSHGTL